MTFILMVTLCVKYKEPFEGREVYGQISFANVPSSPQGDPLHYPHDAHMCLFIHFLWFPQILGLSVILCSLKDRKKIA